eukprot:Platyproteum_vivax@DN5976_c0_g1_i1.p1
MGDSNSNWEILASAPRLRRSTGQLTGMCANPPSPELDIQNHTRRRRVAAPPNAMDEPYKSQTIRTIEKELAQTVGSLQKEREGQKGEIDMLRQEIQSLLKLNTNLEYELHKAKSTGSSNFSSQPHVTPDPQTPNSVSSRNSTLPQPMGMEDSALCANTERITNHVKELEKENASLNQQVKAMEQTTNGGRVGQIAVKAFIRERDTALEALKQEELSHREADFQNFELKERIDELEKINEELETKEHHRKKLLNEVSEMSQLLEESKHMIERESRRHKECKERLRQAENDLVEVGDQHSSKADCARLKDQVKLLQAENDHFRLENNMMTAKLAELDVAKNGNKDHLQKQLAKLQQDYVRHTEEICILEKSKVKAEERLRMVLSEKSPLVEELKTSMNEVAVMAQKVAKFIESGNANVAELQARKKQHEEIEVERNELERTVDSLARQLADSRQETANSNVKLDQFSIIEKRYQETVERLSSEIAQHKQRKDKTPLNQPKIELVNKKKPEPKQLEVAKKNQSAKLPKKKSLDSNITSETSKRPVRKAMSNLAISSLKKPILKESCPKFVPQKAETNHDFPKNFDNEGFENSKPPLQKEDELSSKYMREVQKNQELQRHLQDLHCRLAAQVRKVEEFHSRTSTPRQMESPNYMKHQFKSNKENTTNRWNCRYKAGPASDEEINVLEFDPWQEYRYNRCPNPPKTRNENYRSKSEERICFSGGKWEEVKDTGAMDQLLQQSEAIQQGITPTVRA